MARNPRLRLAQNVGEVGDGQLRLAQERQDPQAGGFGGCLQRPVQLRERQMGWRGHQFTQSKST